MSMPIIFPIIFKTTQLLENKYSPMDWSVLWFGSIWSQYRSSLITNPNGDLVANHGVIMLNTFAPSFKVTASTDFESLHIEGRFAGFFDILIPSSRLLTEEKERLRHGTA